MAITDLIPWKKNEKSVPVRRVQEEDALLDLRSQMNRVFDSFIERPLAERPFGEWSPGLSPFLGDSTLLGGYFPQMDVSESDKEITISAELPGLEPEDINISVDRSTLSIRGEKRAEKEEKGKRFYRVERTYGSFHRSIPLPSEVDDNKIEAKFKRGVLKVKLPKTQAGQEKRKRIVIKSK